MNKKIIIICVAVIAVAGGTAGITAAVTSANNEKEAASLVNEAVSSALAEASTEPTSEEISAQNIEAEITETTEKSTEKKQAKSAENTETTTETTSPQVVDNIENGVVKSIENNNEYMTPDRVEPNKGGEKLVTMPSGEKACIISDQQQDGDGVFWVLNCSDINNISYCIDDHDKIFQHDKDGNRIYID